MPHADLETLRRRLLAPPGPASPPGQLPAAVLVPLVVDTSDPSDPERWYLVLIRRTDTLSLHRGEVAFPGGRLEPGETTVQAALREAEEELAIAPGQVEVLGALAPVPTALSGFAITPWVALLPQAQRAALRPNPAEVAAVIEAPIAVLTSAQGQRQQRFIRGRELRLGPAYEVPGATIWGATARIVSDLLQAIR